MFHATIRSAEQESLRFSGELSPYNVQLLRDYAARRRPGTRVEVRVASALQPGVRRVLAKLEQRGIRVILEA
jgi:hypothetical protein